MTERSKTSARGDSFKVLEELGKDPTRSIRNLASELDMGKQKCWRKKRELETNKTIWGYTTVVDYEKLGWKTYMLCFQANPLDHNTVDTIIARQKESMSEEDGTVVLDTFFTSGDYDTVVLFASKDIQQAKRFYDTVRYTYKDYVIGKPSMMQVMFTSKRGGKVNPEIEDLHGLVPSVLTKSEKR